jgi:zinc D-Ala-D-Ala carboxypeptidase
MHPSTRLSENFRLSEFTKSNTAIRLEIDNTPDDAAITMLEVLAISVAQPIRDHYNKATTISSGYRCLDLNRALNSSDNSQHVLGEAIDLEVSGVDNYVLATWVKENLEYDQLILEFYDGSPASGWVHISLASSGNNRKECLTIDKGRARHGILKSG